MLKMIEAKDLKIENPEANKENAVMMQKRKLSLAIAQLEKAKGNTKDLKPNPIVSRNGVPTIVLRFANHTIAGFPLGSTLPEKAFIWLRDTWLEEEDSQELVWKVYQDMKIALQEAKNGTTEGEEVVH